jgi:heme oxygenase
MQSVLKEQTATKHKIAERKPFNIRMFQGQLTPQEYLVYLEQQQSIFRELEQHPLPHPSLNRMPGIAEDITELVEKGCTLQGGLPATLAYTNYLAGLSAEAQLPHVYLHYLALAYGGQMMRSKVPSQGRMYDFAEFDACVAAIRRLQQDSWVDEVNKGFDFVIDLFDALEENSITSKTQRHV